MALATVRAADPGDVAEITRIQAATWEAAYADLVPEAAINGLRSEAAALAWTAAVDAGAVFVAVEGEWTVGFVAAGPADVPADSPLGPRAWGEIGTLLVEPRWGRRGTSAVDRRIHHRQSVSEVMGQAARPTGLSGSSSDSRTDTRPAWSTAICRVCPPGKCISL
jgi:hypothetical protein